MRKTLLLGTALAATMLLHTGWPALGQTPKQPGRKRHAEVLQKLGDIRRWMPPAPWRGYRGGPHWWAPGQPLPPELALPRRPFGPLWRFGRPFLTPPAAWWADPWSGGWLKDLGLTEQQRREIAEVVAKHTRERILVISDPSLQPSEKVARLRQLRDETRQAIGKILTPEQKEKLRQRRSPPLPPRSRKKPA